VPEQVVAAAGAVAGVAAVGESCEDFVLHVTAADQGALRLMT
jgi:hypothetical protein